MTNNHLPIGKETKQSQALVHIYWDLQNVHLTQKQAELLVAFAKPKGRLDCLKTYYNSQHQNQLLAKNNVEYLGFQGVDVRSNDKNSVDKALTFDWIKRVAIKPSPEIIILVSGDRDFAPLISLMLAVGKTIIVFAQRCKASKKVINLVGDDNFHYIDNLPSLLAGNTQDKAERLSA
ncbi:MAG: NYN domain-containing protein [Oscillatoriales cyanobacterium]|nr:MAG: NYN domain-containing protein [Oscillatoriales cyanobacterium]TAH15934.1 MAG: NYN domain-containing protein [Oscillatoriales cyanobacterium]